MIRVSSRLSCYLDVIRTPIIIYRTTSSRRQLVRWLDYGHPSLYSYSTCASDTIPTNSFDLVPFDFTRSVVRVPRYSSGLSTFGVVRASFSLLLFGWMPPRQYVNEPWSSRLLDWWADRVSIHTALCSLCPRDHRGHCPGEVVSHGVLRSEVEPLKYHRHHIGIG